MKVKELIEILSKADQEAEVMIGKDNNDGCETCGWGATSSEESISAVNDLETRVVLTA